MFNSLGWPELAVLLVVGLFVLGPDRLPGVAAQAGRALRTFRTYARGIRDDLAEDLGPEIREVNLRTLQNPRTLLVKHVLGDADEDVDTGSRRHRAAPAPPSRRGNVEPVAHDRSTSENGGNHG